MLHVVGFGHIVDARVISLRILACNFALGGLFFFECLQDAATVFEVAPQDKLTKIFLQDGEVIRESTGSDLLANANRFHDPPKSGLLEK